MSEIKNLFLQASPFDKMPSSSTPQANPSGNTVFTSPTESTVPIVFGKIPVKNAGALIPRPSPQGSALTDFFTQRSFYRVAIVLGLGSVAFIGWKLYQEYAAKTQPPTPTTITSVASEGIAPVAKKIDNGPNNNANENESTITNTDVILYQCPRGYFTPCIAPFALKLETFLRVANIPYEIKFKGQPQSEDSPWMTVGEQDIIESQNCIPTLCKVFNVDLNKNATDNRKSAANLVDNTLENRIYWGIALWRWVYDNGNSLKEIQPLVMPVSQMIKDVSESVKKASWYHGIGRYSEMDVYQKINKDLEDLSAALGKHQYFLGTSPGEVDCNAFAMLSQMIWNMPKSPFENEIKRHSNLVSFVLRVKEKFWPDWNDILHSSDAESLASESVRLYSTGEFKRSSTGVSSQNSKSSSVHISQEQLASLDTKIHEKLSSNAAFKENLLRNSLTEPEIRNTRSKSPSKSKSPSQDIQNQQQQAVEVVEAVQPNEDDLKSKDHLQLEDRSNGNSNPFIKDAPIHHSFRHNEEIVLNKETNLPSLPQMNVKNSSGINYNPQLNAFPLNKSTPFSEQELIPPRQTYPQPQHLQMPQLNHSTAYHDQAKFFQLRDAINAMTAQVSTSHFQDGMNSNILKLNQLLQEFPPPQSQPQFPTTLAHQFPQQTTWNATPVTPTYNVNVYDPRYMQQQPQIPNNPNQYYPPANNKSNPFTY